MPGPPVVSNKMNANALYKVNVCVLANNTIQYNNSQLLLNIFIGLYDADRLLHSQIKYLGVLCVIHVLKLFLHGQGS